MSSQQNANLYRYEKPLRELFVLPFWLFVLTCVATFSLFSLYRTVQTQTEYARLINKIIAQTATSQNAPLTATQVSTVLQQATYIDNIVFYPISSSDIIPSQTLTWKTYLFQDYLGMNQPVYLSSTNQQPTATNTAHTNQLIGHLYLTLDLNKIRRAWMLRYLALFGLITLLALALMATCFKRIRPFFIRLNHLEHLSEQIINNKSDELNVDISFDEKRWVFSLALEKLIDKQQHLINQIKQLLKKNRYLSENQEAYIHQYSHFQNVITHELKLSLNQVSAGLRLLNSQYASNEQKDAIHIIENGSQKLDDKLNQIIYISRLEKGQIGISVEKFNPTQLLEEIVTNLQPIAREKGLMLTHKNLYSTYVLEGDKQKITTIITSLIENAVKFTEKGEIAVFSQLTHLPTQLQWQVAVADTGIGIPEQYLSQIFQPFFQINPNYDKQFKETGVTLYLIRKLLDLISSEIQVESDVNKGSTFIVTFPLTDWQKSIQYASLKDKKIAVLDTDGGYKNVIETLQTTGATITAYQNENLLLDDCVNEHYQGLVIMPNVSSIAASHLAQKIRQYQTQERTLIIYNHLPSQGIEIEKAILLADGIDYLNPLSLGSDNPEHNEQNFIKNLITYLS